MQAAQGDRLTHAELVARAERWLRGQRCAVITTELRSAAGECADAIGWRYSAQSLLIECKASLQDFRRDAKKPWRQCDGEFGLGDYRYFMVPRFLVPISALPAKWGLLVVKGARVRVVVKAELATRADVGHMRERALMLSLIRRHRGDYEKKVEQA
jgi:hypothetical protein